MTSFHTGEERGLESKACSPTLLDRHLGNAHQTFHVWLFRWLLLSSGHTPEYPRFLYLPGMENEGGGVKTR